MTSPMKGLLKGLRYIARIFEDEKEPEMQIGKPTDVKHVAHIGWEGPSATTPSWMHDFKSQDRMKTETKGSSNKKAVSSGEKHRNKGRRKTSTGNNSPAESPSRAGGSMRPSRRSTGKQRGQSTGSASESGSGLELPQQSDQSVGPKHSRQRKSKGSARRRRRRRRSSSNYWTYKVKRNRYIRESGLPLCGSWKFYRKMKDEKQNRRCCFQV